MKANKTDRTERIGVGIAIAAFEKIDFAFREQKESDYGVDAHIELISDEKPTGQLLGVQLKTGQSYLSEKNENGFIFRADHEHIEYWLNHSLPIIIALCDPDKFNVYWESISKDTVISTGKHYKIIVPFKRKVNSNSANLLNSLVSTIVPKSFYTVFKTEDESSGLAKRYSLDIVLNGLKRKSEIASAIRQVTSETVKRQYYRNHITEGYWGNADADVVWIYTYLSPDDRTINNWLCRSLWIREDLPEKSKPLTFKGENIGGLVIVDWSSHYHELSEVHISKKMDKESYLKIIIPLMDEIESLIERIKLKSNVSPKNKSLNMNFCKSIEIERLRIRKIYEISTDIEFAPFECGEVDAKFQETIALADNIVVLCENSNLNINQVQKYVEWSKNELNNLKYELSKIR